MNKTKVAFFGTSDRSISILEELHKNFDLSLCITKKDTKVGRHQKTRETQVKIWAKENQIPYLQIDSFNKENTQKVSEQLISSNITIGVVADFSLIIPKEIINVPEKKLINVHFSLLPKYRGASPVQAAILNGEKTTGITYFVMDSGMDTGDIIGKVEYLLEGNENSEDLYKKLFSIAALKLPEILNEYILGNIRQEVQDDDNATYTSSPSHPKNTFIYKEDARIAWTDEINKIERAIRAYYPWPIAWTTLTEMENPNLNIELKENKKSSSRVKIYKAHIENNLLCIDELQLEGGKKLSWNDFKNGYVK